MTGALLDKFALEATELVGTLGDLLTRASTAPPDAEEFTRDTRALRDLATMAQRTGIAQVATGLERLARLVSEGSLAWDASVRGTAVAAVDDLKFLVRGVHTWGEAEYRRSTNRVAELDYVAPQTPPTKSLRNHAASLATGPELSHAEGGLEEMSAQLTALRTRLQHTPSVPIPATPATPAALGPSHGGARGAELKTLLAMSIAGLAPLATLRFADPAYQPDDDVIPMEELLFRGREALKEALNLGDRLRHAETPVDHETLAELYDLLQLAAAD